MGKIGDLIVRLQLKHEDYRKGLKQAEKDTKGFSATLGKIKGAGVAVWAAIGASVISFGKQLINSSQTIGDAWARTTAQMKAGWDVFVQSVAAWNWDNFIGRIKEASIAAKALTNALDAEFEVSNSIKLQKAAMAEELAELEILARDQTKTYKERAAAAQKYLDMVKPLYDQELRLAKELEDAQLGKFLDGSGLVDTEQVREDLRKFLVDIGKIPGLMDDLAAYSSAQKTIDKGVNVFGSNYKKVNDARTERAKLISKLESIQAGYDTDLVALYRVYNDMRGDKDTLPLIEAMIRAGEAAGAFDKETKRIKSSLNSSLAQIKSEDLLGKAMEESLALAYEEIDNFDDSFADINLEFPEIDTKNLDKGLQEIKDNALMYDEALGDIEARTQDFSQRINDAVVSSLTGATQALIEAIMGVEGADAKDVLAAMLQPFAQTATTLGEILIATGIGVEDFKTSLATLQGGAAIAAGIGLVALGTAMSAGIQALGTSSSASTSSYSGNSYSSNAQNYESTLTVEVVGKISGNDILISGQKTSASRNR